MGDEIGFTLSEHTNDCVPDTGRLVRGQCHRDPASIVDPLTNDTIV